MEEFRKIPSLNYLYEVSDKGTVRNAITGKVVRGYVEKNGYRRIRIENKLLGSVIRTSVHQLVAECFIPNPDGKPYVNHKDLNKLNNTVENLEWVTPTENVRHAYQNGIAVDGIRRHSEETRKRVSNGIRSFDSVTEAGRWLYDRGLCKNISSGIAIVSAAINGRSKKGGGYTWVLEH